MNKSELSCGVHACQIKRVIKLAADTFGIELQATGAEGLNYHAGQYLALELDVNDDGQQQRLFYTIANGFNAEQPDRLQLIIQSTSAFAGKIIHRLSELQRSRDRVNVTLPMGQAYLQTDLNLPHLLIASGSGISKIKCLTETILRRKPDATLHIYWSNKYTKDFYLLNEFQQWADQNKNLIFTPVLESPAEGWAGRSGYLYQVIKEDFSSFDRVQTYLCGSPNMVYGTIDQLKPRGLTERNCYSDVFEFSPRE